MKKIAMLLAAIVAVLAAGSLEPAKASGSLVIAGRWAGVAFANQELDLNGDGVAGRQLDLKAFDQLPFSSIEGALDTTLVSVGTCAGPGSLELRPLGRITFRGRLGDSLYADIDPAAPNLCFNPASPSETLGVVLAGGTGPFASTTGTGTLIIRDIVRLTRSVTLPGIGTVQAPTMIDSHGEFTLRLQ